MKRIFLLSFFFNVFYFVSAQNQVKSIVDKNGFIKHEEVDNTNLKNQARERTLPLKVSVKLDSVFSDTRARVRIDFPLEIDINKIRTIEILCTSFVNYPTYQGFPTSGFSKYVDFSYKAINKEERFLETEFSALRPNTNFQIILVVLMNEIQDNYIINNLTIFKTSTANTKRTKKLLLVIDKDLENDANINNTLEQYIWDAKNTDDGINFEKYYINNSFQEKWKLYNKIKEEYKNNSNQLRYLFFIGSNAGAMIQREYLNYDNSILYSFSDVSINFYGQINHPAFTFDLASNKISTATYYYYSFQGMPAQDIGNEIMQSGSFDVGVSSIIPNSSLSKKQTILNYFAKLHDYKTLKIGFNKSVLFSDTMFDDSDLPTALSSISARWKKNDVVNFEQKLEHGIGNTGLYPKWTDDYLSKLSTGSHEICLYMGHGAPYLHYFGINADIIRSLPQLNTMFFGFTSCSVGDFYSYEYLAGAYLETGNTLFVRAYTVPIGVISTNNKSGMVKGFKSDEVFADMATGKYFGDCFLDSDLSLYVTVDLGDPLLRLDPVYTETGQLSANAACVGSTIEVPFKINTKSPIINDFSIQISDKNGENFVTIPAKREDSVFKVTIPDNLDYGTNYRFRVVSSNEKMVSRVSSPFQIFIKPSVRVIKGETKDNFLLTSSSRTGNQWLWEGQEISNANDYTYVPEKPGNYTVKVAKDGCTVISDNTVSINVDKPVIKIIGDNPSCMGTTTTLKAPEGFSQYHWYYLTDTLKAQLTEILVNADGIYRLAVGRGKIMSPLSDPVNIVKKTTPVVPSIMLQDDGIISNSSLSTQWFMNDSLLAGETNPFIKINKEGSYFVKVTQDGCSSESNILVVTFTASESTSDLSVKIYPNPNEGVFYVELPQTLEDWQITIHDVTGKVVFDKIHSDKSTNREEVDLKHRKGTYLMKISKGVKKQTMKLIID